MNIHEAKIRIGKGEPVMCQGKPITRKTEGTGEKAVTHYFAGDHKMAITTFDTLYKHKTFEAGAPDSTKKSTDEDKD